MRIRNGEGYGIEPVTQEEIEERKKAKLDEEHNSVLMQETLNAMQEGVIMSKDELEMITRRKIESRRFANQYKLSELAKKAMEKQKANINEEARIDEELWKRIKEADALRVSQITTDSDGIEL